MKSTMLNSSLLLTLFFMSFTNLHCKKQTDDKFCGLQRTVHSSVSDKEGMIVYSNKYSRYAISFTVTTPNNIDTQVIGFVCDLRKELQTVGLRVIVTGTLKKFNNDENMTPEIAGQDLYFFETSQVTKKP